MIRLIMLAVLLVTVPFAAAQEGSSKKGVGEEKSRIRAAALVIHTAAVRDVEDGKSLDSPLPHDKPPQVSVLFGAQGLDKTGTLGKNATYRDAIQWSEDTMTKYGIQVTVTVTAAPSGCNVKYKPVIGGLELDAGATKTVKQLAPRWYEFTCDCQSPPLMQRVDCTNDTVVAFSCPASSQTVKPSEKQ